MVGRCGGRPTWCLPRFYPTLGAFPTTGSSLTRTWVLLRFPPAVRLGSCGTIAAIWIGGRHAFVVGRYIILSDSTVSTLLRSHQRYRQYRTRCCRVGTSFFRFVCRCALIVIQPHGPLQDRIVDLKLFTSRGLYEDRGDCFLGESRPV